ncbi:hypothetical protein ACLX1H_007922 [Fusarium chlamydosporum]
MPLPSRIMWLFSIIAVMALVSLNPSFHGRNSCEGYDLPGVSFALTPDYGQRDYQINAINKAIHQVGLTNVWEHTFDPSIPAMISNRLANHSEPEKLILVVDNSRYGFNLGVFLRDDTLFQEIRHDYKLLDNQVRRPERSLILQRAMESITKPSFGSLPMTGNLPNHIGELVLYGDDIWDPDFRKTLDLVLDAQLVSRVHKDQPVFSPALG